MCSVTPTRRTLVCVLLPRGRVQRPCTKVTRQLRPRVLAAEPVASGHVQPQAVVP
jgi:hypothetical protein